ncbi:MAG: aldehyde dehydrogenase family protein [Gammaproteobacteria bacterium]|nr:aldehyde dehydrogenase family protein [Gammaproteobacteria bacterium]
MPEGLTKGTYIRPTIFADVTNDMTIAQEEIFGPVLCMIPFKDEAMRLANDTIFGLSSGVWVADGDIGHGKILVRRLRAGLCYINGGNFNYDAPFAGFKQSGNGRE